MNKQSNNISKWILAIIGGIILLPIVLTVLFIMSIRIHSSYVDSPMYRSKQVRYYNKKYQRRIQKIFTENGFKGKAKITNYYADHTEAGTDGDVQVTYSEKVNGKMLRLPAIFDLGNSFLDQIKWTIDLRKDIPAMQDNLLNTKNISPNSSFGLRKDVNREVTLVRRNLNSQLVSKNKRTIGKVGSISYESSNPYSNYADSRNTIKQMILNNQNSGKPVGGFYDLDLKMLLASHYGCLNINVETSSEKNSSYIANHLQSYNFNGLWDGEYWVTFTIKTSHTIDSSIFGSRLLKVVNGKVIDVKDDSWTSSK